MVQQPAILVQKKLTLIREQNKRRIASRVFRGSIFAATMAALVAWPRYGAGQGIQAASAATAAAVTVDTAHTLGTLPATAVGMNAAIWDYALGNSATAQRMADARVGIMRFPGGAAADNYHWQSNTLNGSSSQTGASFDTFAQTMQAAHSQALITVNYGSNTSGGPGDPNEAAAWVRYSNVTKGLGIKYWELGNEMYGNGFYANVKWETDNNSDHSPMAYAAGLIAYNKAMKAVDPSIKIGADVVAPGDWMDDAKNYPVNWDNTILQKACGYVDFLDVHWYPSPAGSPTDASLLSSPSTISGLVSNLRSRIAQYCPGRRIDIIVGEMNTGNGAKELITVPNALFAADAAMTWVENGALGSLWWDLHNGAESSHNMDSTIYGSNTYGDQGILSDGNCTTGSDGKKVCEPPLNTPFSPYYGLQMVRYMGAAGDQLVAASADQTLVAAHAVRQANGNLALLLINKDPNTTYNTNVSMTGYTPAGTATTYYYGANTASIVQGSVSSLGNAFTRALPPYSLTTIVMTPATSTPTPLATTPTLPSATAAATAPALPPATAPALSSATAAATAPTFAVAIGASSVSPATVAPGGSAVFTATVSSSAAFSGAIVDFYIYDASGHLVTQLWQTPVSLAAGSPRTVTQSWVAPARLAVGTYTLKMGVFGPNWKRLYAWRDRAATFMVSLHAATNTATPPAPPATNTAQPPTPTNTAQPPTPTNTATPPAPPATNTAQPPTPTNTATPPAPPATNTATPPAPAVTPSSSSCPATWTCGDIGNPGLAGTQSLSNGVWTLDGSGGDMWNNPDQFRYVWQTLSGDGGVSARVAAQTNTDGWAKAGVMLRASTDPGAPFYDAVVTPGNGIHIQYRAAQYGGGVDLATVVGGAPAYLKVARVGNAYTAYTSTSGTNWTAIPGSSITLNLGRTPLAGLAVAAHASGSLGAATLDSVQVTS